MSIAACFNIYNDAPALRGALEASAPYFDNIFIIHSGPGGRKSDDGTIELCEEFGISPLFDDIQKGFGFIRSRLIHECGCEWAFLLDADERFFPALPVMHCFGPDERYPAVPRPNLTVEKQTTPCQQGRHLKETIEQAPRGVLGIRSTRRHWLDFSMKHPAQNWLVERDNQLRIVRNVPEVGYELGRVMHERLIDYRTNGEPENLKQDDYGGPFHDHFHCHFRRSQPGKKEANEANYARLERREPMV